jgi:hypothetical protein
MKVILIPIEPLEERYSIQWDRWITKAFHEGGLNASHVYGIPTSGKINKGSFLDVVETHQYKVSQLEELIKILSKYDNKEPLVLFYYDLWDPGLTTIAYIRDGLGLTNLKIVGCLHAGSYDPNDFLAKQGMHDWAEPIEDAWFGSIVNQIYVATDFHKLLLCKTVAVHPTKVIVTGFPIYPDFVSSISTKKENIIVFPHRLDSEKCPDQFDALHEMCREESEMMGWKWLKTKEECKTKAEYYDLLGRAKVAVSCSKQETWGIAMQEAVLYGCFPVVPNRLSYSEMYPPTYTYNDSNLAQAKKMIIHFMMGHDKDYQELNMLQLDILEKGRRAIPKMIYQIKQLVNEKESV